MHDKIICAKLLSILILWADDKMFGIKFLNSFISITSIPVILELLFLKEI